MTDLSEMLDEADIAMLDLAVRKAALNQDSDNNEQIEEYLIKLELAVLAENERQLKESSAFDSGGTDGDALKEMIEIQNRIKILKGIIRKGKRGD
jgi:hypothetical protein